MTEKEWLSENQLSLDIWHKKYQVNGETFEECAVRETEEETLRSNHLLITEPIFTLKYHNPSANEDIICNMYIAIDDGPTSKKINENDTENTIWVNIDDVENSISYDNLKNEWNKVKDRVRTILNSRFFN